MTFELTPGSRKRAVTRVNEVWDDSIVYLGEKLWINQGSEKKVVSIGDVKQWGVWLMLFQIYWTIKSIWCCAVSQAGRVFHGLFTVLDLWVNLYWADILLDFELLVALLDFVGFKLEPYDECGFLMFLFKDYL